MIFTKSVPVLVENSPRKKNQHKQPKNFNKNSVRRRESSRNNSSNHHQSFHSTPSAMSTTTLIDEEHQQRQQVRSALLRHWTWLDRARLHTFHFWLFVYSLAQIFLFHYLCHRVWSFVYVFFCAIFPALVLASIVLIRYGRLEFSRKRLRWFSLISSVSFPVFLWLIHLPLISEFRVKQERIAELASLSSSLAICTLYQFFVLPRHRRLFTFLSLGFIICNTLIIGIFLYIYNDQLAFSESPILAVIPLFIYQLIVLIVGIICDSNSASSRQAIAQKLTEAIQRRDELEQLKNRQCYSPYLTDKVSKSIFATSSAADFSKQGTTQMKLFHELHVQVHDNVSILFADIVNFTQLAAQLVAKDLVKTLNELYSKFDADAQANFEKY
uniref:adenylate cyclase n=1 Tax=Meloidogyne enterolobii TaxID=390850 RepID=A0A6V7V0D8_MELEN|nr:unnamed protein product [Meloidogyne enterolobii]